MRHFLGLPARLFRDGELRRLDRLAGMGIDRCQHGRMSDVHRRRVRVTDNDGHAEGACLEKQTGEL